MNLEFVIWQRQDQALMSWMLSAMTEGILGTVTSCSSSYEVWALERTFASHTKAKTLQLRMQLQTSKKVFLSITDYYNKMKMLVDSLIAAGNLIIDEDLCLYILRGLELEYDTMVVNTIARTTMPTIEKVYSLLLTHESRLNQLNSAGNKEVQNMSANYVNFRQRGGNNNSYGRGQNQYGSRGNYRGRGNRGSKPNTRRNNSKPTCQLCNKYGHSAGICYYRFDKNFAQTNS